MKGTITRCLADLVQANFGKDRWEAILADAGVSNSDVSITFPSADVPDATALALIQSTAKVLDLTEQEAADAFGEYWCCTYAPKMYRSLFNRFSNAREMILGMDRVHVEMTRTIPNAHPPRFEFDWEDDATLLVTYRSSRSLLAIYMGLCRGVGKHFGESLVVSQAAPDKARIVFG